MKINLVILLLTLFALDSFSQAQKKYLMSFHTCLGTDCFNPQNHKVQLAESDNGSNWTLVNGHTEWPGSVPDVITRNDSIFIFTPMGYRIFDKKSNNWSQTINYTVSNSSGQKVNIVDPSAILDENNNIVLFYLINSNINGDPATCGTFPCTKDFGSAVEKAGSKGSQFIVKDGVRASIQLQSGTASDPDIFYDGNNYNLYISRGQSTELWSSSSLHGNYNRSSTLPNGILTNNGGIPSGFYDQDSRKYWTFVHSENPAKIKQIISDNLNTELSGANIIISGATLFNDSNIETASPGFSLNTLASQNSNTGGENNNGSSSNNYDPENGKFPQPIIIKNSKLNLEYSYVSPIAINTGVDIKSNHQVLVKNNTKSIIKDVRVDFWGFNEDGSRTNLSGGGFAVFPNGGSINLLPGDSVVVQSWFSGWNECNCLTDGWNIKKPRFYFSYTPWADKPEDRIPIVDSLTQDIAIFKAPQQTGGSQDLSLLTKNPNQKISGKIIVPQYLKDFSIELEQIIVATEGARFSLGQNSNKYYSQKDSADQRIFTFNFDLDKRSDYLLIFQPRIQNNSENLLIETINLMVPNSNSLIDTILYFNPFGSAKFNLNLVKEIQTETGFWRTRFSPGDSSIVVFPGQENWKGGSFGPTSGNSKEYILKSKLYKFSVKKSNFGEKLWEYSVKNETWGGGVSDDGLVVALILNQTGITTNVENDPNVDWIEILDGVTGTKKWGLRGDPFSMSGIEIQVSHGGGYIAMGTTGSGTLTLYKNNGNSGTKLWQNQPDFVGGNSNIGQIRKLEFSKDDKFIYCGSGDMFLRKYEVSSGNLIWKTYIGGWPFVNGFSMDKSGNIVIGTKSHDRTLIRDSDGKILFRMEEGGFDASIDYENGGTIVGFGERVSQVGNLGRSYAIIEGGNVKQTILGGNFVSSADRSLSIFHKSGGKSINSISTNCCDGGGEQSQSGWSSQNGDLFVVSARDFTSGDLPKNGVIFITSKPEINVFPEMEEIQNQKIQLNKALKVPLVYIDYDGINENKKVSGLTTQIELNSQIFDYNLISSGDSNLPDTLNINLKKSFNSRELINVSIVDPINSKFKINKTFFIEEFCETPNPPKVTDISYCQNQNASNLEAEFSPNSSGAWYLNENGGTVLQSPPIPNTSSAGDFYYYVSAISGTCESERIRLTVTVKPQPETPIISSDGKTSLTSSALNGNIWYKDGEILADTLQTIQTNSPGFYTVKVSQNGCESKLSKSFSFLILSNLIENPEIAYPNPFKENLTIKFNQVLGEKVDIRISNTLGQEVFLKSGITNGQSINLKQLPSGQYILNIQSMETNGKGYYLKIVKE